MTALPSSSGRPNNPTKNTFGASDRDHCAKVFAGRGLTQADAYNVSPGPAYQTGRDLGAPSSVFGSGSREQASKLFSGARLTSTENISPGPAAYSIPSSFRAATARTPPPSPRARSGAPPPPGFTFGCSSRDQCRRLFTGVGLTQADANNDSPGPNLNMSRGLVAPSLVFGSGTREQARTLFAGTALTRAEDNSASPGPAAYRIPSSLGARPLSARSVRSVKRGRPLGARP
jgi:hypothetical protein